MSKQQIDYLLALATLIVVWLFFHTFYCHSSKICGGMPSGGMMSGPAQRFPNTMGMGMQGVSQPPNITELLKNQRRGWQPPTAPTGEMPPPSNVPQKDDQKS